MKDVRVLFFHFSNSRNFRACSDTTVFNYHQDNVLKLHQRALSSKHTDESPTIRPLRIYDIPQRPRTPFRPQRERSRLVIWDFSNEHAQKLTTDGQIKQPSPADAFGPWPPRLNLTRVYIRTRGPGVRRTRTRTHDTAENREPRVTYTAAAVWNAADDGLRVRPGRARTAYDAPVRRTTGSPRRRHAFVLRGGVSRSTGESAATVAAAAG